MARDSYNGGMLSYLVALAAIARPNSGFDLAKGFRNVPNASRMRMYWRVFGPAWTEPEIDRQLDAMKAVGIGGTTVYFMYPVALDDDKVKNLRFGSPEFLASFGYAARAAKKRGLRFGVNGSTGWPFGGPTVAPDDSAQQIREFSVGNHSLLAGEAIVSEVKGAKAYVTGPTNMQVKRPAFGAEGLVVSHYDTAALNHYLTSVIEPMLKAAPGLVEFLGCDSLEVYGSNWTPDLPKVFQNRCGYALTDHLPELFDKSSEAGKRVRFDFWKTMAELTEERFTQPLGDWCAKRGIALEMEAYGTPPNPMTAARFIQTPVGEHYEWKGFSVQKYVASAAHQANRTVVSAEAWTWAGLPNRLADSLSDLKLVSDLTFLSGSNDLTGVDFPYSPREAGSPGWTPYYGPFMSPANSQWPMFPTLVSYVNRCQWMLRQGQPVRPVAVYLPVEDSFREGPTEQMTLDFYVRDRLVSGKATSEFGLQNALKHTSNLVHGLIMNGLDYDGMDFWTVNRVAKVKKQTLEVGPARYKAVVLPNLQTMDEDALRKVVEFCRAGGIVVATRQAPTTTPGFISKSLRHLAEELFGKDPFVGRVHHCGKGEAVLFARDEEVAPWLAARINPSLRYSSPQTEIGFQHRQVADQEIYFLANVGAKPATFEVTVRADRDRLELWNPMTGEIEKLPARMSKAGLRTDAKATVRLPARGSTFIVAGRPTRRVSQMPEQGRDNRRISFASFGRPWTLRFEGQKAPSRVSLSRAEYWSALPESRFFSGTGIYETTMERPSGNYARMVLELGDVREAAEVRLNGVSQGVSIVPPFEFDLTKALKPGKNRLEIRVVNLPVNGFIGQPRPDLSPLRNKYGNRFPAPEEHDLMNGEPAKSGIREVRLRLER